MMRSRFLLLWITISLVVPFFKFAYSEAISSQESYEHLLNGIKSGVLPINDVDDKGRTIFFKAMHPSKSVEDVELLFKVLNLLKFG